MNKPYLKKPMKTFSRSIIAFSFLTCSFGALQSVAAEYTVNEGVAPNSEATNNSRSELDFFRKLIDYYYASWAYWSDENGQINWQEAEELYANGDDLVFFVPWQPRAGYVGWNSFKEGLQKNVFDGLNRLDLRINDDVEVTRRGDVAWTTSTGHVELDYQDGRNVVADGRMTMIWQQQDGRWQLIHEHFSVPVNAE